MPALAMEYPRTPLSARRAAIEEMFTMQPEPWRPMTSPKMSDGMRVPWRLSWSTSSRASTGTSNTGRLSLRARATLPPAALTRISMRPRAFSSSSRARRTCPASSTSAMSTAANGDSLTGAGSRSRSEQRQVDRVGHQAVPRLVGVQVVARVRRRQQSPGLPGIAQRRVEVDHRIERAAAADPAVHGLPRRLPLGSIVLGSPERRESGALDAQAASVYPGDDLPVGDRSEEHTSELQSLAYLVCRLLLEKKKNNK